MSTRNLCFIIAIVFFAAFSAHAWPGAVVIKSGGLAWGQYKNVTGVIALPETLDLSTAIRAYPLGAVTSVIVRAQRPDRAFFEEDGARINAEEAKRVQQALDVVNTLEMLPIVVLFDPDKSCVFKNAKAYETAAVTFMQTFGKANYFLLCISEQCDDKAFADGPGMVGKVVAALKAAAPRQLVAAGMSAPDGNAQLLQGENPVHVIVAHAAELNAVAAKVRGPVVELTPPSALVGDDLERAVRLVMEEPRYGIAVEPTDAERQDLLERLVKAVDHHQRATYPATAPDPQDTTSLKPGEKEDGFVSLFNGKDLTGWVQITKPENFVVKDGAIKLDKKTGGWLRSWDVYEDFVFRIEFKIVDKGNNGIYVRCGPVGRQSRMGFELQIFGDPAGLATSKESCAAIYDVKPPEGNFIKPGDWNEYELTCKGDTVKVVWNGHVVHQFNYNDFPELQPRSRKGFIGLQDHHNAVEYRNIRIKALK